MEKENNKRPGPLLLPTADSLHIDSDLPPSCQISTCLNSAVVPAGANMGFSAHAARHVDDATSRGGGWTTHLRLLVFPQSIPLNIGLMSGGGEIDIVRLSGPNPMATILDAVTSH